MTEDTQCETMGLQATLLSNPLERFIPPSLKRKPTGPEESGGAPKKLCLEVLKDASSRMEEALQTILLEDNKENQADPKVIVQHSPLPSIYELEQVNNNSNGDIIPTPPLSDESEDSEEDEYNERYANWQQMPPKAVAAVSRPVVVQSPFGFLEQNDQRIECAENGKSYLQLGTMNTPPPPPQPKPYFAASPSHRLHASAARRPPRPLCDHSNCLQRRASLCYRNHRTRMLNVSLHKLHLARQNHEGSLRRSVLICNMLRHIEEEAEKEQIEQSAFNNNHLPPHEDSSSNPAALYSWASNNNNSNAASEQSYPQPQPPPVVIQQQQPPPPQSQGTFPGQTSPPYDTYEMTLKDFNSAFRSTPYGSPVHVPSNAEDGSPQHHHHHHHHHLLEEPSGESINWSSVLNLSSGSSLDPLNNNSSPSYGGGGPSPPPHEGGGSWSNHPARSSNNKYNHSTSNSNANGSVGGSSHVVGSNNNNNNDSSNKSSSSDEGFEDIGWKLSAEDVLKAFPHDEQLLLGGP